MFVCLLLISQLSLQLLPGCFRTGATFLMIAPNFSTFQSFATALTACKLAAVAWSLPVRMLFQCSRVWCNVGALVASVFHHVATVHTTKLIFLYAFPAQMTHTISII